MLSKLKSNQREGTGMTETRVQRALRNVERAVAELREAMEAKTGEQDDDKRWLRLLTKVEAAGGTVSADTWPGLGAVVGYDPRGLGGFYRGAGASMRMNPNDSRSLTEVGKKCLDQYGRVS